MKYATQRGNDNAVIGLMSQIKRLEAQMYKHARNLEFEEAAKIRDTIEKMKQMELGLGDTSQAAG